ncbi:MAG: hypothetical protein ACOCTT_02075 [archaeon]
MIGLWVAADMWGDLRLALTIIAFIFLVKWSADVLDNNLLGVIVAAIIAYLTFFRHYELLVIGIILFFGYPIFAGIADAMADGDDD